MNAAHSETVGSNSLSVGRAPVGSKSNEDRSPRAEPSAPKLCGSGSSVASPHQNKKNAK